MLLAHLGPHPFDEVKRPAGLQTNAQSSCQLSAQVLSTLLHQVKRQPEQGQPFTAHEPSLVRNSWAERLKASVVWCWKSR